MPTEMSEFLFKYVLNNNPYMSKENVESYKALNEHDLLVTYKNGTMEIFDTFLNTSRQVNKIQDNNEEQLKLSFKRKLQTLMNRRWITQEELAKRINSSQQMVSRYLTGQSIPSAITLKKIADALNCNINEFYDDYF